MRIAVTSSSGFRQCCLVGTADEVSHRYAPLPALAGELDRRSQGRQYSGGSEAGSASQRLPTRVACSRTRTLATSVSVSVSTGQ